MTVYIIRRLLLIIPTIWVITIIVFASIRLIPGDVITIMLGEMGAGGQFIDREAVVRLLGMDVPPFEQYIRWVGDIFLRGSFGESLCGGGAVTEMIFSRVGVTFELGAMALLISLLIAIPIGIYSSIRQDTFGDYVGRSIAIIFISVPSFWMGTMVMLYPSIYWGWSPPMKLIPLSEDPFGNLGMFVIPAAILGMLLCGSIMRMTRTMMLEVLRQDYVRTAWAKGLRERAVVVRHALRNALIPVITMLGMQLPILIGGSVIMEQIFVLPGMGRLMLNALSQRDYPVVSGINLLVASIVVGLNLVIDLSYSWFDPRLRYR